MQCLPVNLSPILSFGFGQRLPITHVNAEPACRLTVIDKPSPTRSSFITPSTSAPPKLRPSPNEIVLMATSPDPLMQLISHVLSRLPTLSSCCLPKINPRPGLVSHPVRQELRPHCFLIHSRLSSSLSLDLLLPSAGSLHPYSSPRTCSQTICSPFQLATFKLLWPPPPRLPAL